MGRVDLACHAALEKDSGVLVDELQLLEDLDARLVVGQKLQVLVGQRELELLEASLDHLAFMHNVVLLLVKLNFSQTHVVLKLGAQLTSKPDYSVRECDALAEQLLELELA